MAVYVPNPDGSLKVWQWCNDADEFMANYSDMVEKIASSKLSGEQQDAKLQTLQAANSEILIKIRGE